MAATVQKPDLGDLLWVVLLMALGALSIWLAAEGARASGGRAGTAGTLVTTSCTAGVRAPTSCVGRFTPDDRSAGADQTASITGRYPPGSRVRVRVLDGEAWPTDESGPPTWLGYLILGVGSVGALVVLLAAALAGGSRPGQSVAIARHRKRRPHRSR